MKSERKLYPLTSAQKMHFYTLKYCSKKQVLNIGTSLTILEDIDFNVLKECIYKAYERCEAMRIRFIKGEDEKIYQYIVNKEKRDIEHFNFSHWKEEDIENELKKWTAIPFKRFRSPMNRIVMIEMPQGYKGVYMNVDHMTMDSHGIIVFMEDIIELYANKKYNFSYPKELTSYTKVLEKDLAYEENSSSLKRDKQFWKSCIEESEPIFTDITGPEKLEKEKILLKNPKLRAATITSTSVNAEISNFHLEEEPSNRIMNFCKECKIPVVCLLLMGLRTYLSKMNHFERDITIKSTVSRRGTLLEKKCGGTRVHFFPCRSIIEESDSFLNGIKKLQESQNKIFKHANYDPIAFTNERIKYYKNKPGQSYECMSLTYQPLSMRAEQSNIKDLDIKYQSNWYSNGAAASPLYLTVMHRSLDNGLDFFFEYQTGRVTHKELEYLYYYLCKILFMGIENPEITVGEILRTV